MRQRTLHFDFGLEINGTDCVVEAVCDSLSAPSSAEPWSDGEFSWWIEKVTVDDADGATLPLTHGDVAGFVGERKLQDIALESAIDAAEGNRP
jgi:hypothetical protein